VPESITPLALAFAAAGGGWGVVADRVAARWPAHEDGRIRAVDWRTVVVVLFGAVAIGALPSRFGTPRDLVLVAAFFAALLLLMATDLDQRLLPDEITLPLIPITLLVLLLDLNPVLADAQLRVASGIAAAVIAPLFLFVTGVLFRGALGMGDIKLSISLGLAVGLSRLVTGFFLAAILGGVVLLVLLATRRVGLHSLIPFGPILIVAGFLAVLRGPAW